MLLCCLQLSCGSTWFFLGFPWVSLGFPGFSLGFPLGFPCRLDLKQMNLHRSLPFLRRLSETLRKADPASLKPQDPARLVLVGWLVAWVSFVVSLSFRDVSNVDTCFCVDTFRFTIKRTFQIGAIFFVGSCFSLRKPFMFILFPYALPKVFFREFSC